MALDNNPLKPEELKKWFKANPEYKEAQYKEWVKEMLEAYKKNLLKEKINARIDRNSNRNKST